MFALLRTCPEPATYLPTVVESIYSYDMRRTYHDDQRVSIDTTL